MENRSSTTSSPENNVTLPSITQIQTAPMSSDDIDNRVDNVTERNDDHQSNSQVHVQENKWLWLIVVNNSYN